MRQRNWPDLHRKLVDKEDFIFTIAGMTELLGEYAKTFFGVGVLKTTTFPDPFPIVLDGGSMGGTVGTGIAYDPEGAYTSIETGTGPFFIPNSDPALDRWDLLVIRYSQEGYDTVPKPSDPIVLINLNLRDSYELAVVPGVASATPAYPAKGPLDVILAGIKVPAGAAVGTDCSVDLSIREIALPDTVKFPSIFQEPLNGVVDGINTIFTTTQEPAGGSLILTLNGLSERITSDWSIAGNTITFVTPPEVGQTPYGWYIYNDAASVNPLAAQQEQATGLANGVNDTFALTGTPGNQASTLVWKDGILIPSTLWSLVQSSGTTFIKYNGTEIPDFGQDTYVWYLVNPASIGIAAPPTPGNDGALEVYGSPVPVNVGAGGYTSTADQRSLVLLRSFGGAILVTNNPQISPGSTIGQELKLKGTSAIDYPVFQDGNGLSLNGDWLGNDQGALALYWDGAVWQEDSRR